MGEEGLSCGRGQLGRGGAARLTAREGRIAHDGLHAVRHRLVPPGQGEGEGEQEGEGEGEGEQEGEGQPATALSPP